MAGAEHFEDCALSKNIAQSVEQAAAEYDLLKKWCGDGSQGRESHQASAVEMSSHVRRDLMWLRQRQKFYPALRTKANQKCNEGTLKRLGPTPVQRVQV